MLFDTNCELPSASKTASLSANICNILSSQSATKSESLACSFWILPYIGLKSLVIFSACINWFKLFIPLVELYIPE